MALPKITKYYWIQEACDAAINTEFDAHVREARRWAARAVQRMRSGVHDPDFARVFNVIFRTPVTDDQLFPIPQGLELINGGMPSGEQPKTAARHVYDALLDFCENWERTDERERADVRFYGDGGARWRQVNANVNNSGRELWYDLENKMYLYGNNPAAQAAAYGAVTATSRDFIDGQSTRRITIDVTPRVEFNIDGERSHRETLDSIASKEHLEGETVETLGAYLISRLVFHHFMLWYGLDENEDIDPTHLRDGWDHCMALPKGKSCVDAECVAYLGLWAGLADCLPLDRVTGGYTMDRAWDAIQGTNDARPNPAAEVPLAEGVVIPKNLLQQNLGKWQAKPNGQNQAIEGVINLR
ncbi:hypothetical protein B0H63DRAFT_141750 [Podospora didyma]|uniref:Uncharacterized protein n=1 Tax=Podospora didyma TaxID=330526 RepID=A0AAE0U0W1_9PEZI|nr:hypothetical protein B0H63DRAFT_141750 [Podospora didyma]